MNITLKIDGSDYTDKIVEESFIIRLQVEGNYNEPTSSVANFILHNDTHLENYFLISDPYAIILPGYVEITLNDFPQITLFKGYINRESAPEDLSIKNLAIEAIGIEQSVGDSLSGYDITQLYHELGDDISQRGNRLAPARYNSDQYLSIENFINTIFTDLGLAHYVEIPNSAYFKYKYNEDKYGDITGQRYAKLTREQWRHYSFHRKPYGRNPGRDFLTAVTLSATKEIVKDDDTSYNVLLRDWASLTGCVYYYNYATGVWYFVPRNYIPPTVNPFEQFEDYIVDDAPTINYRNIANSLKIDFTDLALGTKRETAFPIGINWKYGIGTNGGDKVIVTLEDGYVVGVVGAEHRFLYGASSPELALRINNNFEIKVNDDIYSYRKPVDVTAGENIKELIDAVRENYDFIFTNDKSAELVVWGLYPAPQRVKYAGQYITVYDIELDIIENTSTFRFEYQ